jgi:hypothetical protein
MGAFGAPSNATDKVAVNQEWYAHARGRAGPPVRPLHRMDSWI